MAIGSVVVGKRPEVPTISIRVRAQGAIPERLASRYAARLVVAALLGTNAALRAAQFELYGRKKIGTRMGPYIFWRARRDSNSRPLGS